MEGIFPVLLIAGVIAIVVVGAIWSYYAAKKRREDLARIAASVGFEFFTDDPYGLAGRYGDLHPLDQGDRRYAYNVLAGEKRGYPLLGFDFHYQTYTTDSKGRRQTHHHYLSAFALTVPFPMKPLVIRPERLGDKIAGFFGFDDIDFESAEFSRRFYVKGPDRKFAYDVIHARMMEFLMGRSDLSWNIQGSTILVHFGSTVAPGAFLPTFDSMLGFVERLPEYLLRDLRGQA